MSRPLSETTTVSDVSQLCLKCDGITTHPHTKLSDAARSSDESVPMEWITGSDAPANTLAATLTVGNATSRDIVRISRVSFGLEARSLGQERALLAGGGTAILGILGNQDRAHQRGQTRQGPVPDAGLKFEDLWQKFVRSAEKLPWSAVR